MRSSLALMIPVLHEEGVLERAIHYVMNQHLPLLSMQGYTVSVVIALNGSNAETRAVAESCVARYPQSVQIVSVEQPGRGRVLRKVVQTIEAEVYAYCDVDLPVSAEDFCLLVDAVAREGADVSVGKRVGKRPWFRRFMSASFRMLSAVTVGVTVHDAQCGVKVWNAAVAHTEMSACTEDGFFCDTEMLARAGQQSRRIVEIPVQWIDQRFPDRVSSVHKIRDSIDALRACGRMSWRLCRAWIVSLCVLSIVSVVYVVQFALMRFTLQPAGFGVAHHLVAYAQPLFDSILMIAVAYLVYSLVCMRLRLTRTQQRVMYVLVGVVIACVICAIYVIHPTRSQDVYWNLALSRGHTTYGLNPYLTTPNMLVQDGWSDAIRDWRNLPMTHGPAWVLLLDCVTSITDDLHSAVLMLRSVFICVFLATLYGIFRLLTVMRVNPFRRASLFAIIALNPLWFQHGLIDMHNDLFIACAMVWSVYALYTRRYAWSICALVCGGLIKYTPWLLLIVPLYVAWKERASLAAFLRTYSIVGAVLIAIVCLCYVPFGFFHQLPSGLEDEILVRGAPEYTLLGTQILSQLLSTPLARGVAFALALGAICMYTFKKNYALAYSVPFLIIFFCGTTWFQSWYPLWIVGIVGVVFNPLLYAGVSAVIFLLPDILFPISAQAYVCIAVICALICFFLQRTVRVMKGL